MSEKMKKFYYTADSGSIMLGTKDFKACYSNGYGDGDFLISIYENEDDFTEEHIYDLVDVVAGTFNVYDYDGRSGEPLITLEGRYGLYRRCGNIALVRWSDVKYEY